MKKIKVNEKVSITAMGFRKNLDVYPSRMEFRGVTYHFIDAGIRCLLHCGEHIAEFFTLSDGQSCYQLKLDHSDNDWTLISITS